MSGDYKYCPLCGTKLILEDIKDEGLIPYCPNCKQLYFPHFNVACSMIIKYDNDVLLIKQYGGNDYILVAGYLKRGESAEEAAIREVKEEVDLDVNKLKVLKTKYFSKSNTLMINVLVEVNNKNVKLNYEVDNYSWFGIKEALDKIKPNSLALEFYKNFYTGFYNND